MAQAKSRKRCIARKSDVKVYELPTGFYEVYKGRHDGYRAMTPPNPIPVPAGESVKQIDFGQMLRARNTMPPTSK